MSDAGAVDAATGAFTRSHFEALLLSAVKDARRTGEPLCVLWVDVDELTEANDVAGREAADAALAVLTQALAQALDGRGAIGRVGGGAFAVALGRTDLPAALRLAEAVRGAAAGQAHRGEAGSFKLTVSCGVAQLREGEPWGNLLDAAEEACTRAKQGGRDQVAAR